MSLLVVGSVALDSVETPFGRREDVLGGSATYFSTAASFFGPVRLVATVGEDFPEEHVRFLAERGVDLAGLERRAGRTFRWKGRYEFDLNTAHTLETQLNVFGDFQPALPAAYRDSQYVFLGNIDPDLQRRVLDQVEAPRFVACDTMNFWIESRRADLLKLLERVDVLTVNDAEARQLTEEVNLVRAARWIMRRGPRHVIIKKGENGAFMFTRSSIFFAPAYPLEAVFDPTGAGDSFAGGFLGHLARNEALSDTNMKRAVVYGSAMGSFAVEKFSITRILEVGADDIVARVNAFYDLVAFERGIGA